MAVLMTSFMSKMKNKIKTLLGYVIYGFGLHKVLLRGRSLVVAFHRVSDEIGPSEINCRSSEFARYCDFLARHFTVLPLSEVINRIESGQSVSGTAAITFDDGYHDNAHVAAPILSGKGLHATFFIATGFIGSTTQTFWDEAEGVRSEWMCWEDVRNLRVHNFDIGCHTENHVDLGRVDRELARAEIENSKARLEAELQESVLFFAYPFGGMDNIRHETLEVVKSAGFGNCFSCHGGLVANDSDLYALPREPITRWHESPYHFGFELLIRREPSGSVSY